ncbi:MAG TPA: 6,7-dimethyl-8-ribityllumazine synthase [Opitutaceae bacterium]|jgi:6,7-dimethyl-8-ribityllumazine synthase|nr:6,7-dimethyl-8-ribityllumazine synthase [Opitutaceae bacterium]
MSRDSHKQQAIDGSGLRFAIAAAQFNGELVGALLERVQARLASCGVKERNVRVVRVPGSNELPVAAQLLADAGRLDAVIALGVIVRGDTIHYELIATAATNGLMDVALESRIPVINGVVVAENESQARARCNGRIDRGAEFADAALAMAALRKTLTT